MAEPTIAHAIEILRGLRDRYEAHHRVSITDGALVAAAQLADRYVSDRFLPDKAIDLIDEAGSRMRIRRMTAPPGLRDFDEKIARVRREKESAIDSQDFEKAAALRDTEKQLRAKKATREKERKAGDMDAVAEVTAELIAEVLATATGIPVFKLTAPGRRWMSIVPPARAWDASQAGRCQRGEAGPAAGLHRQPVPGTLATCPPCPRSGNWTP